MVENPECPQCDSSLIDRHGEALFPYSEKGVKNLVHQRRKRGMKAKRRGRPKEDWLSVLTVSDRTKNTYEAILPSATAAALHQELTGKLAKDSVLFSEGYEPYIKLSAKNDVIHLR